MGGEGVGRAGEKEGETGSKRGRKGDIGEWKGGRLMTGRQSGR